MSWLISRRDAANRLITALTWDSLLPAVCMGLFVVVTTPAISLLIFHTPGNGYWLVYGISYAIGSIGAGIGLASLGRHLRKRHRKEPEAPGG